MKLLKELTEAQYYQNPSKTTTSGRVINRIVRDVFAKFGREILANYNDKYRRVRRLSYQPTRKDWGNDPNIPSFDKVKDAILYNVQAELRKARSFSDAEVSWHRVDSGQGSYMKLVVKLPLSHDERTKQEPKYQLKNELIKIRRKGPHRSNSPEYHHMREIQRRLNRLEY